MREPTDADDPLELVAELYESAQKSEPADASRFVLATHGESGPAARFLLLKYVGPRGFGFVTNHDSRKGRELRADSRAALALHWSSIDVQVRAEGHVVDAPEDESDAYFRTRPRGSQIGAWASPQSQCIDSREDLERAYAEAERRFEGVEVPRPPHWGLCYLVPDAVEIWYGRPSRLHDRHRFDRTGAGFKRVRLAP